MNKRGISITVISMSVIVIVFLIISVVSVVGRIGTVGEMQDINVDISKVTTVEPQYINIGDYVEYIPALNPNSLYESITYVVDTDVTSSTFSTYIEGVKKYTPGNLRWIYLGKDKDGNFLLISDKATEFNVTIAGEDGYITGANNLDKLCDTLFGNNVYGKARSIKIEDVNMLLGFSGGLGEYENKYGKLVESNIPKTIREIEKEMGRSIRDRETPRLSNKLFEDYVSDDYAYYADESKEAYKLIFNSEFWLSTPCTFASFSDNYGLGIVNFGMRYITEGRLVSRTLFNSQGSDYVDSYAVRPVIVLNSNIKFGTKNAIGEWTLKNIK